MHNNSMQYEDDEDFSDEESQENSINGPEIEDVPGHRIHLKPPHPVNTSPEKTRRLRIRPMSPSMLQKYPNVVSIVLTKNNGQQLIFIRK